MAKRRTAAALGAAILVGSIAFTLLAKPIWKPIYYGIVGRHTVGDVLRTYGTQARETWTDRLKQSGLAYPPERVTFVALKQERKLEVWVPKDDVYVQLATYPILAASGVLGPKLREGDLQVPEGIYEIEGLNPNSSFHLSMKVNYPNAFDRARAKDEGRANLGGDIFIHGNRVSIGCLAMGDPAIEELFVLVADVGYADTGVLIAPCDFRAGCSDYPAKPEWMAPIYAELRSELTAKYSIRD